jgi:flagellar hook assembly protein FlgD
VTTIRFDLPVAALVDLAIYDVSGRMVRGLIDESLKQPGRHTAYWNGLNGKGERVASGVYFCRLRAGSYVEIGEVLLLK